MTKKTTPDEKRKLIEHNDTFIDNLIINTDEPDPLYKKGFRDGVYETKKRLKEIFFLDTVLPKEHPFKRYLNRIT